MTAVVSRPEDSPLSQPVISLLGVGEERSNQLGKLGIFTIEDLLLHRPRRYEDRRRLQRMSELQLHDQSIARGKVVALGVKWFARHTKSVFELILDDGTARLHCRWWNIPYMEKYFTVGEEVIVCGKLLKTKPRIMDHPEVEVVEVGEESFIHFNRITPVYPLTEGMPQRWLRALIWRTLEQHQTSISDPWSLRLPVDENSESPSQTRRADASSLRNVAATVNGFPTRAEAVRIIHFPDAESQIEQGRRRLALDEFIVLQQGLRTRRSNFEAKAKSLPCRGDNRFIKPFLAKLGFKLTDAQTRVLRELRHDLSSAHPMRRLLQGDVGSGKTVVAACSALMAIESGFSVALMAPTEILAEQHFEIFRHWFEPLGVAVELRTGTYKVTRNENSKGGNPPASHSGVKLHIGTHALIESGFTPENLGLVIIDEQHRFGVAQREQLVRKGNYPHLLVMTATPIPRTLGLTLYGELDISVLDQSPAGRGKIKTFVRESEKVAQVWEFISQRLKEGRQAFVVYPRVEETGDAALKAVTREYAKLETQLKPFRVGLLHGRMKTEEKEQVMASFRANETRVLLSTSVIEVGIDVPNATVMLIENAERFGLAQLHQLRGRVGRGTHDSYCILVVSSQKDDARQRLNILEKTIDGFEIAEADLKLRGPGELLGQQQSGMPAFRFGDLVSDYELIRCAQKLVAIQAEKGSVATPV